MTNAIISDSFRDRRRQREKQMQERCQFLEGKVKELEKKLKMINKEKDEQDNEV